jgi:Uma2 family endonuclease
VAAETAEIHRLTLDEYHQLIDSGGFDEDTHVELIDGLLLDKAVKSAAHENAVMWLSYAVHDAIDHPRYHLRVSSALTLHGSEPEPDLYVYADDAPRPYHPGTASLVIEVSHSSLRRDLQVKPRIYANAGIPRYWVIDLDGRRAIVHSEPAQDEYARVESTGSDATLTAPELGISVSLAELLAFAIR